MTTTKSTTQTKTGSHTTALWLGDLHFDQTSERKRKTLLNHVHSIQSDCVVMSGDISQARHLQHNLSRIASVCAPRNLYFVPGNHEFHSSSIATVEANLTDMCKTVPNLHYLNGTQIIPLGHGTCLIGHRGWADARAGYGHHTVIDSPDRHAIHEFHGLSPQHAMDKMTALGHESARIIRGTLPLALSQYKHVVILTHVPPFPTTVRYNDQPCGNTHLPHFANLSVGLAILGIARAFPRRQITVLSGHSHSGCVSRILPNLTVRVGHARTGSPGIFDVIGL